MPAPSGPKNRGYRLPIAALLLLALIWGCYYVASQQTVKQMSVFTTGIVIRFLTMIFLLLIMGKKKELPKLMNVYYPIGISTCYLIWELRCVTTLT